MFGIRIRTGRLALALCLLGGMIGLGARAVTAGPQQPAPRVTHVVQPGETLWQIARRLEPAADPRSGVQRIIDENRLGSAPIFPGQRLILPRS